ncbi:MAG: hypothetical protein ABIN97_07915 [Ginsengibacter sp.]
MIKQFILKKVNLFFFAIVSLTFSCNNTNSDTTTAETTSTDTVGKNASEAYAAASPETRTISGVLDTLWIDVSTFMALKKKIAFRFYVGGSDTLTMHGWSSDDNIYKDTPDVKLIKGKSSGLNFGAGNYLGNLILRRGIDGIRRIKDSIAATSSRYVLFAPQDPKMNNGQIFYKIFLTKDDPHIIPLNTALKATPTGINLNPSPPKSIN